VSDHSTLGQRVTSKTFRKSLWIIEVASVCSPIQWSNEKIAPRLFLDTSLQLSYFVVNNFHTTQ
jgi:hypothetical protein